MGLVRDRTFARTFGAGSELDVYNAALILPELVLDVLVIAGLSAAFVPVFAHRLGDPARRCLPRTVLTASALVMIVAVGVLFVIAPLTVDFVAPGFDAQQRDEYTELLPGHVRDRDHLRGLVRARRDARRPPALPHLRRWRRCSTTPASSSAPSV